MEILQSDHDSDDLEQTIKDRNMGRKGTRHVSFFMKDEVIETQRSASEGTGTNEVKRSELEGRNGGPNLIRKQSTKSAYLSQKT